MEAVVPPPQPSEPRPPAGDEGRAAIVALARRLTTPVDLPALVAQGVLCRRGPWWRRWYEVLDPRRLPEWAVCQIRSMRRGPRGTVLVRFGGRNAAAERLYEELTGGPPTGRPEGRDAGV